MSTVATAAIKTRLADSDIRVPDAGPDSTASLSFGKSDQLVSTNWDGCVRLWSVQRGHGGLLRAIPQVMYKHEGPVLNSCFLADEQKIVSAGGGAGNKVLLFDIQQQKSVTLGGHAKPVRTVNFLSERGLVVTGGFDGIVSFFDTRAQKVASVVDLNSKVFAADTNTHMVVLGTADRKVHELDTRGSGTLKSDKSSLIADSQTRAIAFLVTPNGKSVFAVGGDKGRGAVQGDKVIVKNAMWHFIDAGRNRNGGIKREAYAINAVAPHKNTGIFATAGSDGYVKIWDGLHKQFKKKFQPINRPITAAKFNHSGELLAYASCYDWSKGADHNVPGNDIFIHSIDQGAVKPHPVFPRR